MDLVKELDNLLEKCAASMPPDYFTFYEELIQMLSGGIAPREFCEAYAAHVKEIFGRMEVYSNQGERGEDLTQDERAVFKQVAHRSKLLLGGSERLPVEFRKLISEL